MKDPYTLICTIKIPYGPTVGHLWHRDRDGCDGACGWSRHLFTPAERRAMEHLADAEAKEPYFLRWNEEFHTGDIELRETLYRSLVLLVADMMNIDVSFDEAAKMASRLTARGDGFSGHARTFCFKPGYHTNNPRDTVDGRHDVFASIIYGIAGQLMLKRRPWYRHPRWHVHHWRLTLVAVARWRERQREKVHMTLHR